MSVGACPDEEGGTSYSNRVSYGAREVPKVDDHFPLERPRKKVSKNPPTQVQLRISSSTSYLELRNAGS
jgi:hypothetical protein